MLCVDRLSLDEAIEIAARIPSARTGAFEVRLGNVGPSIPDGSLRRQSRGGGRTAAGTKEER
jgi:hypothetical protein